MTRITFLVALLPALALTACAGDPAMTHSPSPETGPETRANLITGRGNPITLEGRALHVGQPAPEFTALATDLTPRRLSDFSGQTVILTTFPKIDTSVCAAHVREFNQRAAELPADIVILAISVDEPAAQKEWCAAEGINNIVPLSIASHPDFATAWGLRIAGSGRLARATYIIDPAGIIRYEEIVPEITNEPNYPAALAAARSAAGV